MNTERKGKIVLERDPAVKQDEAILQVKVFSATGRVEFYFRIPSYTGNVPQSVRADLGGELLRLLRSRFGNIVEPVK